MYYNTTGRHGTELESHRDAAASQEENLLEFMTNQRGVAFTADQIEIEFPEWPRASVTRALSNLTDRELIEKSSSARWVSKYKRACNAWRVK